MQDSFSEFPNRNERLSSIYRYEMFDNVYYRSSVWLHAQRVALLVQDLRRVIEKSLPNADPYKAYILAFVHDDAEMITGDIQRGHKMRMSNAQLEKIDAEELTAIEKLAEEFPKQIEGYNYKELLKIANKWSGIEGQIVNFADKMDAFCECLHEVFAGNIQFIGPTMNYYSYHRKLKEDAKDLTPLFKQKHPLLDVFDRLSPLHVSDKHYSQLGKPHTKKSIQVDTDFPWYNRWRTLQLENFFAGEKLLTKRTDS